MENINGFILDRQLVKQLGLNKAALICMLWDKSQFYTADQKGYFYMSRDDMQNETGIGKSAIMRYCKEFVDMGIINEIVFKAGNKANRYKFLKHPLAILSNCHNSPIQSTCQDLAIQSKQLAIHERALAIQLTPEPTVQSNRRNEKTVTTALAADNDRSQTVLRSYLTPLEIWMDESKQYKHK
jgi:hypothetical protein